MNRHRELLFRRRPDQYSQGSAAADRRRRQLIHRRDRASTRGTTKYTAVGTTTPVSDKARSHVGQVAVIGPDKVMTVMPTVTSGKMDTQVTTTRKWMDGTLTGPSPEHAVGPSRLWRPALCGRRSEMFDHRGCESKRFHPEVALLVTPTIQLPFDRKAGQADCNQTVGVVVGSSRGMGYRTNQATPHRGRSCRSSVRSVWPVLVSIGSPTKAGVNKERIYQYFGKKEAFFSAVLEHELATTLAAVELSGRGVSAIADYAGRRFDYQREHPTFTRLLFWEGLELEAPVAEASRQKHAQAIVASAREAVPELSESDAQELLITVITLVDGWVALQTADRLFSTPLPAWSRPGLAPTRFHRDDGRGRNAGRTHPNPVGPNIAVVSSRRFTEVWSLAIVCNLLERSKQVVGIQPSDRGSLTYCAGEVFTRHG